MDPNACFQLILDALETHDPDERASMPTTFATGFVAAALCPPSNRMSLNSADLRLPSMRGAPMKRPPAKPKPDRLLLLTDRIDRLADQLAVLTAALDS